MDLYRLLINTYMYMSDVDWKHKKKIKLKISEWKLHSYALDCVVYTCTYYFVSWWYHLLLCLGCLLLLFLLAAPLSCSLACSRCFLAVSWVGSSRKVCENSSIASLKFFCSALTTPAGWIWSESSLNCWTLITSAVSIYTKKKLLHNNWGLGLTLKIRPFCLWGFHQWNRQLTFISWLKTESACFHLQ